LFTEVNYQIGKYTRDDPSVNRGDFLLATGDKNGWGTHVDYISGWQQDVLGAALQTCVNTDQNNPNCSFHQFVGDIPEANNGARPGSMTLFKRRPVEAVTNISELLVTGKEAIMSGFPAASCTWGPPAHPEPAPLINKKGVVQTSHCPPVPTPPTPAPAPTPVPAPTPPPAPAPAGSCVAHEGMDVVGAVVAQQGPGKTAADCCAGCTARSGCKAAVLFQGWCYYKDAAQLVKAVGRTAVLRSARGDGGA
jgi:hypothetical protein